MSIYLKVEETARGYEVFGYSNGDCYGKESELEHPNGFASYEDAIEWARSEAEFIGANLQTTHRGIKSSVCAQVSSD